MEKYNWVVFDGEDYILSFTATKELAIKEFTKIKLMYGKHLKLSKL